MKHNGIENKYKKKYLKYKKKYLRLKNQKKIFCGGDPTDNFKVIKNSGGNGEIAPNNKYYSNQCMWLSIIDYLRLRLGIDITLGEIREIASKNNTPINGPQEKFDSELHGGSLENIIDVFELNIRIYNVLCWKNSSNSSNSSTPSNKSMKINGDTPGLIFGHLYHNIVHIVSYGAHFELIVEIDNVQLYGIDNKSINNNNFNDMVHKFEPSRALAIGSSREQIDKLDEEQEKKLSNLIDGFVNLNFLRDDISSFIEVLKYKASNNDYLVENISSLYQDEDEDMKKGIGESLKTENLSFMQQIQEYNNTLKLYVENIAHVKKQIEKIIK